MFYIQNKLIQDGDCNQTAILVSKNDKIDE